MAVTALPLRPALADVLETLTDQPRGHWLARFADPSLRGAPTFVRGAVSMSFAVERFRSPARENLTPLTITDPAEAYEALIARDVLPDEWARDDRRSFVHTNRPDDGWGDTHDVLTPHPPTISSLVAWASLGPAAILRAEELARETVERLRSWGAPQPERVVWRVGPRPTVDHAAWRGSRAALSHRGVLIGHADHGHSGPIDAACALWDEGLALDGITDGAVTIVVPPVGAS